MKRLSLVLVVMGLVVGMLPVAADVPSFVTYSGRLTDGTGCPTPELVRGSGSGHAELRGGSSLRRGPLLLFFSSPPPSKSPSRGICGAHEGIFNVLPVRASMVLISFCGHLKHPPAMGA